MKKITLFFLGLFLLGSVNAQTFSLTKTESDFNSEFGKYFKEHQKLKKLFDNITKNISIEKLASLLKEDEGKLESNTLVSKETFLEFKKSFFYFQKLRIELINNFYGSSNNYNPEDFKNRVEEFFKEALSKNDMSLSGPGSYLGCLAGCAAGYSICMNFCIMPEDLLCTMRCMSAENACYSGCASSN